MGLSPRLHLQAKQSLSMSPQMVQSIKLLHMNTIELDAFINAELEKNPLLERDEGEETSFSPNDTEKDHQDFSNKHDKTLNIEEKPYDFHLSNDYNTSNYQVSSSIDFSKNNNAPIRTENDYIQDVIKDVSLHEYIQEQIMFTFSDPIEQRIALELSEELDEAGYFHGNENEIISRFNLSKDKFALIFKTLQEFEPIGVFARDLSECLALQLKAKNHFDPAIEILLKNLPELAKRNFQKLAQLCQVNEEDLIDMVEEIRSLDPKPGKAFSSTPLNIITPDLIIEETQKGDWLININPAVQPKLLINYDYSTKITSKGRDKKFLDECLQNANWLIRALDQRAKTLINVMSVIVEHQQDFLRHGVKHLRPLTLAQIAESVKMHESTISRISANKYVTTPRGTLSLRQFFSTSIGESTKQSSDAVRQHIRDLIAAETIDNILSDDDLVALLKKRNINIARRTIAKYRDSMNIPSSTQRKREKGFLQNVDAKF